MTRPDQRGYRATRWPFHLLMPIVLGVATTVATLGSASQPAAAVVQPVVASGGGHSCALMPDQTVWCWGQNTTGQLGDGATANSLVGVKVASLPPALDVAAGYGHSCAVDTSHLVWCWGSNSFGELGNGTTSTDSVVPVQALNIHASQVSVGRGLSCAVTLAQRVRCWGDNNFGELGDGSTNDSSTPKLVSGLTGATEVAAGYFHACALLNTGKVYCWGDNTFGDLGNGTTTLSDVPVPVVGLEGAEDVEAGAQDTCAILIGGDLKCWGDNSVGQLGTGNFNDALVPAQVVGLGSSTDQVSLGEDYGCAIVAAPAATGVCWGDAGTHGQLGNGRFSEITAAPTLVFGLQSPPTGTPGGPEQIAAGSHHACVVLFSGKVECWGEGSFGNLGDGSMLDRAIPTPTVGLPEATGSVSQVSAGRWTGCAVTAALNARCWGQAVGDGSPLMNIHTSAVMVKNLPGGHVAQVSADYGGCALILLGGLASGLKCWGDNTWGELGNNTTQDTLSPVTVQGLSNQIETVTTGGRHTCVLVHNGGAWCWGDNHNGDLGDGTTTQRQLPVAVQSLPLKLADISAGGGQTCAVLTGGSVKCWGDNGSGQLGNGSTSDSSTPVTVTGLSGAVQVAAGEAFSCALTNAGSVECWGNNSNGQLGNSSTTNSDVPVQVSGLVGGVIAIAAGGQHACAVLISGQVDCWGANQYGQLGDGSTADSPVPVLVGGFLSDQASISADVGQSSCSLNASEQAECWGQNVIGQLGDGTTTNRSVPVSVTGL